MENLTLIKHLTDKQAIEYFIEKLHKMNNAIDKTNKSFGNCENTNLKSKDITIKNIEDDYAFLIRELSFFIKDSKSYKDFPGYIKLAEYVIDYLKSTNTISFKADTANTDEYKSLEECREENGVNESDTLDSLDNKHGLKITQEEMDYMLLGSISDFENDNDNSNSSDNGSNKDNSKGKKNNKKSKKDKSSKISNENEASQSSKIDVMDLNDSNTETRDIDKELVMSEKDVNNDNQKISIDTTINVDTINKGFDCANDININSYSKNNQANKTINTDTVITASEILKCIDITSNILEELLTNMEQFISIDIYFFGEDKYSLLTRKYLKKNIYKLDSLNEINYIKDNKSRTKSFKMLLLGGDMKYTLEFNFNDIFDEVIDLNKINEKLFDIAKSIYKCEYNYNFLKNEMKLAEEKEVDTLIIGNGHARAGIKENLFPGHAVNLSIYNQDIHYSFELAKKVIDRNPNIKKCVIGIGHYSSLYKLDKVKTDEANTFINNTYKRLLDGDKSVRDISSAYDSYERDSILTLKDYVDNPVIFELFNLEEVGEYLNSVIYTLNPNYFNNIWTRAHNSVLKYENFELLNSDDKFSLGIWRANRHNQLLDEFSQSNIDELTNMLNYLNLKDVYTVVALMPVTNYYMRFLDEKYKEKTEEIVESFADRKKFKYLDFNQGYSFEDSDFIDVDHLNERGAVKLTKCLNNTLKWAK